MLYHTEELIVAVRHAGRYYGASSESHTTQEGKELAYMAHTSPALRASDNWILDAENKTLTSRW